MKMTEKQLRSMMVDVVKTTLEALGIEACEPRETQSDMIFLRKVRLWAEAAGSKVVIVIAGVIASGIAGSVWFALKHYR